MPHNNVKFILQNVIRISNTSLAKLFNFANNSLYVDKTNLVDSNSLCFILMHYSIGFNNPGTIVIAVA